MKVTKGKIILVVLAGAVVAGIYWALQPTRLRVETVSVATGLLVASVDEEGETRAHDRFVVSSPVSGRLRRVELHDGDVIRPGQIVAVIDPSPLDPREREEVIARVDSAEASSREATEHVQHARSDYEQAHRERERSEKLVENGLISVQAFEQARNAETTAKSEVDAAIYRAQAAVSEVQVARAGLVSLDTSRREAERQVQLRSPVGGRVLRIIEKSERIVTPGTPILAVGDARRLEVVVDVLSTDAVNIQPGDQVLIEHWGGDRPIRAKVRTVEPSAFTKVSALGVEEQRVNIIADFVDAPGPLGDGYRVETRIVTWQTDRALKAPLSALFRSGDQWSVFVVENGIARARTIELGHRSDTDAEVLGGLKEGERVIPHPTSELKDGTRVETDR